MRESPGSKLQLSTIALITLLVVMAGVYIFHGNQTLSHLLSLKTKKAEIQDQAANLIQQNHELKKEIERLKNDMDYKEKLIREEFGYARSGEKIIWTESAERAEPSDL